MFKSIRARLTAAFSLYLAVLVGVSVFGLIWYSGHSTERSADNMLKAAAQRAVLEASEPDEQYNPSELINDDCEDIKRSGFTICIVDRNGLIRITSQKDAPGVSGVDYKNWRTYIARLRNGDSIVIGMPWSKTRRALRSQSHTMIWLGVFVVVVASAGAWILVGRTLRPISALAKQAKLSSADNLSINLTAPSQDREMQELVGTLNGLLHRITETTAAKGRFYSAASHELRTPLQALSGHLELALNRERTGEEYKAAVEEAYIQTRRLISLSRSLLTLYQLDSSTAQPPKEPVNLVDVCRGSLDHYGMLINERRLQVNVDLPGKVDILAPPNHIDMLVRNLVENAVKYSPEQGQIGISITEDAEAVCLEVVNDCVLPPNWKPDELFEPFSRPDSSRNAKTGGSGLGLAICKSIADANDWQFNVKSDKFSVRAALVIPIPVF